MTLMYDSKTGEFVDIETATDAPSGLLTTHDVDACFTCGEMRPGEWVDKWLFRCDACGQVTELKGEGW